jgi:hypothetical protein
MVLFHDHSQHLHLAESHQPGWLYEACFHAGKSNNDLLETDGRTSSGVPRRVTNNGRPVERRSFDQSRKSTAVSPSVVALNGYLGSAIRYFRGWAAKEKTT